MAFFKTQSSPLSFQNVCLLLYALCVVLSKSAPSLAFSTSSFLSTSRLSSSSPINISRRIGSASTTTISSSSSTAIAAVSPGELADYSAAAIQFFQSIRTPAALIAGSSLGNFFIMVQRVADTTDQYPKGHTSLKASKLRVAVLFFFHVLSLSSMLLSLNTVATATCASNTLLTANYNPMAFSAYDFLRREIMYEYFVTQWSFYAAIICFLNAVMLRALIEFNLLRKGRLRTSLVVIFGIMSLVSHILHVVNASIFTNPDFWSMSLNVFKLFIDRVWFTKSPMLLLSFASMCITLGSLLSLIPRLAKFANEGEGWIRPKDAE